ncbi:hypothetical protein ACROYT_G000908 [Oculina patagonica]
MVVSASSGVWQSGRPTKANRGILERRQPVMVKFQEMQGDKFRRIFDDCDRDCYEECHFALDTYCRDSCSCL